MNGTKEELDQLVANLHQEVEEMKRNLRQLETARFMRPTVEELLAEGRRWEACYAWRPVKDIHGQWHWLDKIYRLHGNTYVDHDDWKWYHYGTVFDVLKAN